LLVGSDQIVPRATTTSATAMDTGEGSTRRWGGMSVAWWTLSLSATARMLLADSQKSAQEAAVALAHAEECGGMRPCPQAESTR
jgi:hypothetical protein